jgi:predicted negative regulator of RcsB-dependent stress response
MHERVVALIETRKADEALALCHALRAKRLASGDLLLATAQCLHAMGKNDEAVACIRGDFPVFVERSPASVLQQVGDMALQYGAKDLARDAYRAATEKMLEPDVVQ